MKKLLILLLFFVGCSSKELPPLFKYGDKVTIVKKGFYEGRTGIVKQRGFPNEYLVKIDQDTALWLGETDVRRERNVGIEVE